ncbi:MAG: hypothetical protein KC468_33785, partial [Myxococcales bacterium]|nr:hypothetical protein [Myxococcales bacterium]
FAGAPPPSVPPQAMGAAPGAAPGYPFSVEPTGLADAPPIPTQGARYPRGPFDPGPQATFDDVGSYEPERLLGRRGPSVATFLLGGTLLAGVAAAAFVFGGDLLDKLTLPAAPVEDVREEDEPAAAPTVDPPAEATADPPSEAPETAGSGDAPAESAGATAGDAPSTAGDEPAASPSPSAGEPKPAVPEPAPVKPSGGTTTKKSTKTTKKSTKTKTPKTKRKTKREERAEQAAERDPGRVIYELQMLSAAKKALAGKPLQALAYAEQHASEFPRSQFVEQRREIMIKALCKLGRTDRARGEAQKSAKAQRVFDTNCK